MEGCEVAQIREDALQRTKINSALFSNQMGQKGICQRRHLIAHLVPTTAMGGQAGCNPYIRTPYLIPISDETLTNAIGVTKDNP